MSFDSKKYKTGVFIDGSNIFWGSLNLDKSERWFVDYFKFKSYLKEKYKPEFYKYYGAIDTEPKTDIFKKRAETQEKMYLKLEGMGYDVITKPLKYIKNDDGSFQTKGDMDIELTMGIIESADDLDCIVLVSGDCDYNSLVKNMHAKGKYIRIMSFDELLSWELRTFAIKNIRCSYKTLDSLKDEIKYEKVLTNNTTRGTIQK